MMDSRRIVAAALTLGLASPTALAAEPRYGPGVTDTEIKLGQTAPYSGPGSPFGTIGRAQQAYFAKINAEGGIKGRKIRLISLDDSFNLAKTVEQTRRLIEGEEVLAMFSSLGPGTVAVRRYVNQHKIPYLFVGDGDKQWDDGAEYPWSVAFIPSFESEGRAFGRYILRHHANARVAVLAESGVLGKEGLRGLREILEPGVSAQIVAVAWHEIHAPTRDSQLLTLKASGADVLVDWSSPRNAAQVIRRLFEMAWRPVHLLSYVSGSIDSVLKPAGLEASVGIISTGFMKHPSDPTWKSDLEVKEYLAWMRTYYPDGDAMDVYNAYGYLTAQAMVHVLRQCADDLTRENLMRQATGIRDLPLPLLLPGIKVDSTVNPSRPLNQLQMLRFNGVRWRRIGEVLRP